MNEIKQAYAPIKKERVRVIFTNHNSDRLVMEGTSDEKICKEIMKICLSEYNKGNGEKI